MEIWCVAPKWENRVFTTRYFAEFIQSELGNPQSETRCALRGAALCAFDYGAPMQLMDNA
jgi:hypothetical protein